MFALAIFLSFTLLLSSRCVTATASNTGPVVQLSYGSFQGNATADLEEFLGMPFAAPP
jgi:acetylcholinesterase